MSVIKKIAMVAAAVLLFAMTATPANNAEQVIFSTPGFSPMTLTGNSTATSTPFGFWIWCAAEAAGPSKGGYQNFNACQGNVYFYSLDKHANPIIGFVTEGPDGIYTMHVFQGTFAEFKAGTLSPDFSCILTNASPVLSGPHGTNVHVECGTPATAFPPLGIPAIPFSSALGGGSGVSDVTNATVNVTGS